MKVHSAQNKKCFLQGLAAVTAVSFLTACNPGFVALDYNKMKTSATLASTTVNFKDYEGECDYSKVTSIDNLTDFNSRPEQGSDSSVIRSAYVIESPELVTQDDLDLTPLFQLDFCHNAQSAVKNALVAQLLPQTATGGRSWGITEMQGFRQAVTAYEEQFNDEATLVVDMRMSYTENETSVLSSTVVRISKKTRMKVASSLITINNSSELMLDKSFEDLKAVSYQYLEDTWKNNYR